MFNPRLILAALAVVTTTACTEELPALGHVEDELLINVGGNRWCDSETIGWRYERGGLRESQTWNCCTLQKGKAGAADAVWGGCSYDRTLDAAGNATACRPYAP